MRKSFCVSNGRFVDVGFPGFFSCRSDKVVFTLEIIVGFSNPNVSNVYVWGQRGRGQARGRQGDQDGTCLDASTSIDASKMTAMYKAGLDMKDSPSFSLNFSRKNA